MQVYGDVEQLVSSWVHPKNASIPMFNSVAWDFRRDMYEQAERVMVRLDALYAETGCKAIVIGHSFGGRLIYATLARYKERAAQRMAGTLYSASPLQGVSTQISGARPPPEPLTTKGFDQKQPTVGP